MNPAAKSGVKEPGVHETIRETVGGWPGVEALPHRFGGTEFRLGRVEIGHLHGDRLADLPFPRKIRDRMVAEGRAVAHHVLPNSGWVSKWIDRPGDVEEAISLFRLNYDRHFKRGF